MDKVAILGGTFDPVHWGHLWIAQTALSQIGLDRVIWVPNRYPPHKSGLAYEHRQVMVEIAIEDNPAFSLEEIQTANSRPDYALFTLLNLQTTYRNCQWYWILGLDTFRTLPQWYCRERLIPACEWLVAPRFCLEAGVQGSRREIFASTPVAPTSSAMQENCQQVAQHLADQNIQIRWQLLQMPSVSISSSAIRQYCRQHRSIRDLVPEKVRAYINTHHLYLN
ncbi:MAG TPA: nicotinate (nicotinamide) nucleotide adenylyltransferase [Cyanobacteria bacterium UBA8803]|nr:nicotinate (nicotinamide) nucleotide adenylyltransferase [Cyanobacteria bacterium UBA9273]HBL61508.1 nicotinate (nicotinamide) nucleotide adenylyltransferase [Cyanobacteria bacterium UBA8803]